MSKKGLILAILIILFFLFFAFQMYNVNAAACKYAEFGDKGNPDYLLLECGNNADGLCPEDYGGWSECDIAGYDPSRRCSIPDLDCAAVPDMYFVDFPAVAQPDTDLTIKVRVNAGGPGNVLLYRDDTPTDFSFSAVMPPFVQACGGVSCDAIFSVPGNPLMKTPGTGGQPYRFIASLDNKNAVMGSGVTTPTVQVINSVSCGDVQTQAYSGIGITKVEYRLEQAGNKKEVQNNAGSCQTCNLNDCNLFQTATANMENTFPSTGVLTANCLPGSYDVIVTAYDQKNFGSASASCDVNPPPDFVSRILKLNVARIKLWL